MSGALMADARAWYSAVKSSSSCNIPEQGFVPGTDKDRCACYDSDAIGVYGTSLRVYPDCDPAASSCPLPPKAKLTAEHAYRQKAE